MSDEAARRWQAAADAATLLAVDPVGLGGALVRGPAGTLRDDWLTLFRGMLPEGMAQRRMPPGIDDDRLLGGLDLAATLARKRPVHQAGLLTEARGGVLILPMAERLEADRLGRLLQSSETLCLLALDESEADEEGVGAGLADRLAFVIDFRGLPRTRTPAALPTAERLAVARGLLPTVQAPSEAVLEAIVGSAAALGVYSLLPPLMTMRAARAAAALAGRSRIEESDLIAAVNAVLAPRATQIPPPPDSSDDPEQAEEPEPPPEPDDPPQHPPEDSGEDQEEQDRDLTEIGELQERVLEAAETALPDGLLDMIAELERRGGAGERRGSGAGAVPAKRGRPKGHRSGPLRGGDRLDLVATLRAAAPWQPVRRSLEAAPTDRIAVRPSDFRIRRFVKRREMTTIFCVDASGSTALQRLAEAKGAVELLLGEVYVERTYAALIIFRGQGAELLLPPTRSLSRAKAMLASLPGGGGTPLAAGLDLAALLADQERRRGRDPLVVMLTDGRANIARDGAGNRARGLADSLDAAQALRLAGVGAVMIDTAPRSSRPALEIAEAMAARYVSLPRLDAGAVRDAVIRR